MHYYAAPRGDVWCGTCVVVVALAQQAQHMHSDTKDGLAKGQTTTLPLIGPPKRPPKRLPKRPPNSPSPLRVQN